jgi:hypothetical protein
MEFLLPPVVALLVWWLGTGVVMLLDGLPRDTFRWSLATSTVIALGALVCIARSADNTTVAGAYAASPAPCWPGAGTSWRSSPAGSPARARTRAARPPRADALQRGGAGDPLARAGDHRDDAGDRRAHLGRPEPGRPVDLRPAVDHAAVGQAQPVPRRAQPRRGVPATASGLPGQLLPAPPHQCAAAGVAAGRVAGGGVDDRRGRGRQRRAAHRPAAGGVDAGAGPAGAPADGLPPCRPSRCGAGRSDKASLRRPHHEARSRPRAACPRRRPYRGGHRQPASAAWPPPFGWPAAAGASRCSKARRAGWPRLCVPQGGFTFDAGPTIVTVPHLFDELWALAGRRLADDVSCVPMDPFYRVRFDDGTHFDYCGDPATCAPRWPASARPTWPATSASCAEAERLLPHRLRGARRHRLRLAGRPGAAVPR